MSSVVSPESLIQTWLGEDSAMTHAAIFNEPLYVPYTQLPFIDGWIIWLGHPPVPDWATLLPAPEHLLWGDPIDAIGVAMMVAADYAVRRDAFDTERASRLLRAESPIAVIVPGELHQSVKPMLDCLEHTGVPVVHGSPQSADELSSSAPSFAFRAHVHRVNLGRPHDPACSFESFAPEESVGGNSLSSYVVHNEGERDEVTVTGEFSSRVGIEIGVGGDVSVEQTVEIERLSIVIPGFLSGVVSSLEGNSLRMGWRSNSRPEPKMIGEVLRIYLKSLIPAPLVDVRIAFAPPSGRSALLSDMRARASAFRTYRDAVIAGDPDPLATVSDQRNAELD